MAKTTEIKDDAKEFQRIFEILNQDIEDLLPSTPHPEKKHLHRIPDPTVLKDWERRALVRSIFAFIEGVSYFLRQSLLEQFTERLTTLEQMALGEISFNIRSNGAIQEQRAKLRTLDLIKLTIHASAKALPKASKLECKGPEYDALARSLQVRDRLMHPKSAKNLSVSDQEIKDAVNGYGWFTLILSSILAAQALELRKLVSQLAEREHNLETKVSNLKSQIER